MAAQNQNVAGTVDSQAAVQPASVGIQSVRIIQTAQQKNLENMKVKVAKALIDWFSEGRLNLENAAIERMFPGIAGTVLSPNGTVQSTSFLGEGCIAYSGMIRLGSDVFDTSMTPNKMQDQLDNAWLPQQLDTDPLQLTYPVLGGAIVNGSLVQDYNPDSWEHSINIGATTVSDNARILGDPAVDALPILGYRLVVKSIDNHVGDTRVVLTAYDTSKALQQSDIAKAPVIYKTTLHMGQTAVNDFTGLITVLPLRRSGLVNLDGGVRQNKYYQYMFSGCSAERLQDYEVMMNVARLPKEMKEYLSDFTLRIDAANAIVYVLPIYPLLSDYYALTKLISANDIRAYVSYLHTLSNNSI